MHSLAEKKFPLNTALIYDYFFYDFSLQTNVFINSLKYECYNFDLNLNLKFVTDPKHKSKRTLRYKEDNYIPRWPTPPQSPDL